VEEDELSVEEDELSLEESNLFQASSKSLLTRPLNKAKAPITKIIHKILPLSSPINYLLIIVTKLLRASSASLKSLRLFSNNVIKKTDNKAKTAITKTNDKI
jgi:hypothetical protein